MRTPSIYIIGVELAKADDSPLDLMIEVVPGCPLVSDSCTLGSAFCSIWSIRVAGVFCSSLADIFVTEEDKRRRRMALPCPVTTTSSRLMLSKRFLSLFSIFVTPAKGLITLGIIDFASAVFANRMQATRHALCHRASFFIAVNAFVIIKNNCCQIQSAYLIKVQKTMQSKLFFSKYQRIWSKFVFTK